MYCEELTKKQLEDAGIKCITEDGHVFNDRREVKLYINKQGYYYFNIYRLDENNNRIKRPIKRILPGCTNLCDTYVYAMRAITLHRAVWAWYKDIVPAGYVVDHKNNKHLSLEDYNLNNLQIITPKENINKDSSIHNTRLIKMPKYFNYEKTKAKLELYEKEYEIAKINHDAAACRRLRANLSTTNSKLRQYEADPSLAKEFEIRENIKKAAKEKQKLNKERINKLKDLQYNVKLTHKLFTDNPNEENRMLWKQAIRELEKARGE